MKIILYSIGLTEIIIIAVLILLLFGGRKIPELMRGVGKGIKEFKNESKDKDEDTEA
ncbi:MAG: twin-arginine translocase TatA/TatE family subunit [Bacteroidales bacterium]